MRTGVSGIRLGLALLVLTLFVAVVAGCARTQETLQAGAPETLKVSLLVQVGDTETRWFRDVAVPKGTDAFDLTQLVTKGDMKATYYPQYRSHFVDAIFGTENATPNFWTIWLWNDIEGKWEMLPVGADFYSVKDGQTLAWYYVDTSVQGKAPPVTP